MFSDQEIKNNINELTSTYDDSVMGNGVYSCEQTAKKVHNPILSTPGEGRVHFLGRGDLKGTKWAHKFGAQWHGGMICYTYFRITAETTG